MTTGASEILARSPWAAGRVDSLAGLAGGFHTHFHVFPRYAGDCSSLDANWQRKMPSELDIVTAQVTAGLHDLGLPNLVDRAR